MIVQFFWQFPCIDYIIKSENLKEYKNIENKNSKNRCLFLMKVALYIYLTILFIVYYIYLYYKCQNIDACISI